MLLNATKAYARQLPKGKKYDLIQPVYTLAVINETYTPGENNYYHHYAIVNVENSEEVIEGLEFVLVELPKFKPETADEKKMRVLWLRFLKEVGETVDRIDPVLLENEHLKEAVEICEVGAYTRGELEAYDKFWDIVSMDRTLTDNLAETIRALEKERIEREKVVQSLAEKDQVLAERDQALAEKDKALAESQKLIESLQKQLGAVWK
jgi:hypothetical protein